MLFTFRFYTGSSAIGTSKKKLVPGLPKRERVTELNLGNRFPFRKGEAGAVSSFRIIMALIQRHIFLIRCGAGPVWLLVQGRAMVCVGGSGATYLPACSERGCCVGCLWYLWKGKRAIYCANIRVFQECLEMEKPQCTGCVSLSLSSDV